MLTSLLRPFTTAAALGLAAVSLIGCTADRHTYRSTATAPKSVAVTYVQSGETAWSYDIPPGQQLTLEFTRPGQFNGFKQPQTPATGMKWYTNSTGDGRDMSGHPGKFGAQESGEVELSGAPIQMNVEVLNPAAFDNTPAPIEVVPAPPAFEEPPAPPAMTEEMEPVDLPEPQAPAMDAPVMDAPEIEAPSMDAPASDVPAMGESMMDESVEAVQDAAEPALEK